MHRPIARLLVAAAAFGAVLVAASADDGDWSMLGKNAADYLNGPRTLFYDSQHVESAGDTRTVDLMLDFDGPQRSYGGPMMLSSIDRFRIDCTNRTVMDLRSAQFAGHMGHGTVVFRHVFPETDSVRMPVPERSPFSPLLHAVCDKPIL